MKLTVGSLVHINVDNTGYSDRTDDPSGPRPQVYACRGHDPLSDRYWLCICDPDYDGYSGDLIVTPDGDVGAYIVVLCDERSDVRGRVTLTATT